MEEAETFSNLIKHKNEKKLKEMAYLAVRQLVQFSSSC